jgi:hypothetical protein
VSVNAKSVNGYPCGCLARGCYLRCEAEESRGQLAYLEPARGSRRRSVNIFTINRDFALFIDITLILPCTGVFTVRLYLK